MNTHNLFLRSILLLMVSASVSLTGCNKNKDDLNDFISQTKKKHVGSVAPIPQFKPYESFVYSASEMRDPFAREVEVEEEETTVKNTLRPDSVRPKEELESYPLDTLSMVGTLEQNEQVWALIKDPKNIVHKVQPGNYIGQNEGRIIAISDFDISLVEIISDGTGGYIERDASLSLGN